MKKFLAAMLCVTTIMSLTACGKKEPGQTDSPNPTASLEESFETVPDGSSTPTTTIANPASEYVKDKVEKIKLIFEADPEEGDEEEEEEAEFHYPEIQIKSSYAESVNKEIAEAVKKYMKDLENEEAEHYFGSAYAAYLTKDNILSVVFMAYEETDLNAYKVYNFDAKTGEKVENARIAKSAGVSDIRKAAMDALQNWYNQTEIVQIKDYKVVRKNGEKYTAEMKEIEKTFSEKYLNDKLQIGITNEGKLFFITTVDTTAGAELYDWVFDADGNDIDDEDNPYWVGQRSPDEEEDDEGDEDDEDLPDDPDM